MTPQSPVRPLTEHPDFEDIVRAAADYHGMLPALVAKDYWVVRVLRAAAGDGELLGRYLFKGGTSLSKGWGLIDRFSEDIDLLFTGPSLGPPPTDKDDRERLFRHLRARIESDTPLRLPERTSVGREEWEFLYFRNDWHYSLRYSLPGKRASRASPNSDWLLVESGFRGGPHPHAPRAIASLVATYVATQPQVTAGLLAYEDDLASFAIEILKPERTLAEKLLGLHVHMSDGVAGAARVRIRHYYDVAQLMKRSVDVQASLQSGEFPDLVREAARVSNAHFGTSLDVDHLDLRSSPALNPTPDQMRILRTKYDDPNERALYYQDRPSFDEVMKQAASLRDALMST